MRSRSTLLTFLGLGFLLLLSLICFFQTPTFDDFIPYNLETQLGLGGAIRFYLFQLNNRFSSIPLFLSLGANRFLLTHYWMTILFFIAAAFGSYMLLLKSLLKNVSDQPADMHHIFIGASALQLLFLTSIPEPSSFYYWMATSVTYLFGFILLLLLVTLLLNNRSKPITPITGIALLLLKILIAGSIEVALAYSLYVTALLVLTDLRHKKLRRLSLVSTLGDIAGLSIFFLLPGGGNRADHFAIQHGFLPSFVGSLERSGKIFAYIFSNPVFWLFLFLLYGIAARSKHKQQTAWLKDQFPIVVEALLVFTPVFLLHFVIRQFGNEVLPPRAENLLTVISLLAIGWVAYRYFLRMEPVALVFTEQQQQVLVVVTAIILLSTPFIRTMPENLFTLYFQKKVVDKRVDAIVAAKAAGKKSVSFATYAADMKTTMSACPLSPPNYVFKLPPSLTYFKDDPFNSKTDYAYANYYGIDSIQAGNTTVVRHPIYIPDAAKP